MSKAPVLRRAAGSAAPFTKPVSGRGGLPAGPAPAAFAAPPGRPAHPRQMQELTAVLLAPGIPSPCRESRSKPLAALAPYGWRYAPGLSVIFYGKVLAPIRRTGQESTPSCSCRSVAFSGIN